MDIVLADPRTPIAAPRAALASAGIGRSIVSASSRVQLETTTSSDPAIAPTTVLGTASGLAVLNRAPLRFSLQVAS